MGPILEAARERGIAVIEDAAQAIGAFDEKGRNVGTMGEIGCFSFFPSKNLGAFGDGGMVVTDDEKLAESLRVLRVQGSKPKYHHRIVGGNFRLDALQAAVLGVKLRYLKAWTDGRRANAQRYRALFKEFGFPRGVVLPEDMAGHIYNQFVIQAPDRDRLQAFLKEQGIGTEVYYPLPLHLQECFNMLGYKKGGFPHAERAAQVSLALPIYPDLTEAQRRYVVEQIGEFYAR
jgi:dTDP-4-amino-4,6-dideoxygalactose transaminase